MKFFHFLKFVIICWSCFTLSCFAQADSQSHTQEERSYLMTLLDDATPAKKRYRIQSTIETDYQVVGINAYLYDKDSDTFEKLEDVNVNGTLLSLDFFRHPMTKPVVLFHMTYGPDFIFNRNSEAFCLVTFTGGFNHLDDVPCNPFTTTQYLIAASMINSPYDQLISADVIESYFRLSKLSTDSFTYQYYLAVHQLLLYHVAETQNYIMASSPGGYLKTLYPAFVKIRESMIDFRQIDITTLDEILKTIDPSMVNIGYRIFMALHVSGERHLQEFPLFVNEYKLLKDFFAGVVPLDLTSPEASVVPNFEQLSNQVSFGHWPWFDGIQLSFDSAAPLKVDSTHIEIDIPANATLLTAQGLSQLGRFSRSTISLSNDSAPVNNLLNVKPATPLNTKTSDGI